MTLLLRALGPVRRTLLALVVLVLALPLSATASAATVTTAPASSVSATTLALVAQPAEVGRPRTVTVHLQAADTSAVTAEREVELWWVSSTGDSIAARVLTGADGRQDARFTSSPTAFTVFARFGGADGLAASESARVTLPGLPLSTLTLSAGPTSPTNEVVLTARLGRTVGDAVVPAVGHTVQLFHALPYSTERAGTAVTDASGVATFVTTVWDQPHYYASFHGDSTLTDSRSQSVFPLRYAPPAVGAIGAKYEVLGGRSGLLGPALRSEQDVPGGRVQEFSGGRIYWSPQHGAYEVHGLILERYTLLGGTSSFLGMPVSDEEIGPAGVHGRVSRFTGGSIYWSPATGARVVQGAILEDYRNPRDLRPRSAYPTTDELPTPDGVGRFNHFTYGMSIYWTPATGAHALYGAIREHWAATGWERNLGYPLTTELYMRDGARRVEFQHGEIFWSRATGAHFVRGALRARWRELGATGGRLGFPVSDEYAVPGGMRSDFQGGSLFWNARTGVVTQI